MSFHRTSSHLRGSCSRGRVRLYCICFLIRSTYSHDREHHFGSCGIHGISDHSDNTCSSFEPDDGHISVLLFKSVAHELVAEETREEYVGLQLKQLEDLKVES